MYQDSHQQKKKKEMILPAVEHSGKFHVNL